jgi:hypothetical protein
LSLNKEDYKNTIKKTKTENIHNIIDKRSDSSDFDKRISSRYIDKKKKEYYNKNSKDRKTGDSFVIIDDNIILQTKPFKTECILHDRKNNSFKGELTINNEYNISFELEKNSNKTLYYNSKYYTFSLLSIRNFTTSYNYFYQLNYLIEINLKDNRYFLFKFPPSTYEKIVEILEKYVNPEHNASFFNYSYLFHENYSKNIDKEKKIIM